jgi:CHAP domain
MASSIISQANDTLSAAGAALNYIAGQCTRFVAESLSWIPSGLGNAGEWLANAQAKGLPTGSTPAPGAVAVWGKSSSMPFGHVAVVQGVVPGGIQVAEENWIGTGITDVRTVTGDALGGIIGYIYPPGGAGGLPNLPNPLDLGGQLNSVTQNVGHGLANALGASLSNVATWTKNMIVPLVVALVVALVLFVR